MKVQKWCGWGTWRRGGDGREPRVQTFGAVGGSSLNARAMSGFVSSDSACRRIKDGGQLLSPSPSFLPRGDDGRDRALLGRGGRGGDAHCAGRRFRRYPLVYKPVSLDSPPSNATARPTEGEPEETSHECPEKKREGESAEGTPDDGGGESIPVGNVDDGETGCYCCCHFGDCWRSGQGRDAARRCSGDGRRAAENSPWQTSLLSPSSRVDLLVLGLDRTGIYTTTAIHRPSLLGT